MCDRGVGLRRQFSLLRHMYIQMRHLPWIARRSLKTVRTPNLKISYISTQNGPIGVHRLKFSTCSIRGNLTKLRIHFKYIIMYVSTEKLRILIKKICRNWVSPKITHFLPITPITFFLLIRFRRNSVRWKDYVVYKGTPSPDQFALIEKKLFERRWKYIGMVRALR